MRRVLLGAQAHSSWPTPLFFAVSRGQFKGQFKGLSQSRRVELQLWIGKNAAFLLEAKVNLL